MPGPHRLPSPSHPHQGARAPMSTLEEARRRMLAVTGAQFAARPLERLDALTGLSNRSAFRERLGATLGRRARRPHDLMLACIDVEDLEDVKATHGRQVGDDVLKTLAARLATFARDEADAIGRCGSDAFVCLMHAPGTLERASRIAGELFETLSEPCSIGELSVSVRSTMGVACFPHDGTTPQSLLMQADAAKNRARHYRTGYAFYTGMLDAAFASPARAG